MKKKLTFLKYLLYIKGGIFTMVDIQAVIEFFFKRNKMNLNYGSGVVILGISKKKTCAFPLKEVIRYETNILTQHSDNLNVGIFFSDKRYTDIGAGI